jgi:hypothetical protein
MGDVHVVPKRKTILSDAANYYFLTFCVDFMDSLTASMVQWFLTTDPEVPGVIPGATTFSE